MAEIRPFSGLLYSPDRVELAAVVAAPYDIITRAQQEHYHQRHPANIVRIELGQDLPGDHDAQNRHTRAADLLRQWVRTGLLRQDADQALYLYAIDSHLPDRGDTTLWGVIGLAHLEALERTVRPHEETHAGPMEDRLRLLRACRAHVSPIVGLYPDPEDAVLGPLKTAMQHTTPRCAVTDENGTRHRVWTVTSRDLISTVQRALTPKALYLADGHHRYEAALRYQHAHPQDGTGPHNFILLYYARLEDNGLVILPTHRVLGQLPGFEPAGFLERLGKWFVIEEAPDGLAALLTQMSERGKAFPTFGLYLKTRPGFLLLSLKEGEAPAAQPDRSTVWRRLDVSLFQRVVLEAVLEGRGDAASRQRHVYYTKDAGEAVERVRRGESQAAFLLNPPRMEQVRAVADAGERMPHKSTYFYPKPLTGLVLYAWDL